MNDVIHGHAFKARAHSRGPQRPQFIAHINMCSTYHALETNQGQRDDCIKCLFNPRICFYHRLVHQVSVKYKFKHLPTYSTPTERKTGVVSSGKPSY